MLVPLEKPSRNVRFSDPIKIAPIIERLKNVKIMYAHLESYTNDLIRDRNSYVDTTKNLDKVRGETLALSVVFDQIYKEIKKLSN